MIAGREETPLDREAVRLVNEEAFGRKAGSDPVDALRARNRGTLSPVAVLDRRIVGHILFTPVTIESQGEIPEGPGLGPMAVLPSCQRPGTGSLLVQAGLEACRNAGYGMVFVLGHPDYCPRFGFVPASRYHVRCDDEVPDDVFLALELREGALPDREAPVKFLPDFNETGEVVPIS